MRGALIALLAAGCAIQPPRVPEAMPAGKVAVVAAQYPPTSNFNALAQGRSAAAGQLGSEGAAGSASNAAVQGLPLALALGPFGVAVYPFLVLATAMGGAVSGAVEGAVYGLPAEQANSLRIAIDGAIRDMKIQQAMTQSVIAMGKTNSLYEFTDLSASGPSTPSELPSYKDLRAAGYDSVLEVTVTNVGFEALRGDQPRVSFDMTLRVRVIPLREGNVLVRWYRYGPRPRAPALWAADDGKLLQEAFDECYRTLTEYVSETVFVRRSAK